MKRTKKINLPLPLLLVFIIGFTSGYLYYEDTLPQVFLIDDDTPTFNVCFSPEGQCEKLAIQAIQSAKDEILMQCYSFTSKPIANALIQAHNKGVKVELLFDRSQLKAPYSQVHKLKKAGIPAYVDQVDGIAHNKVIIIDTTRVLTGSYNFSRAANERNAENMIVIHNPDLAKTYRQKWLERSSRTINLSWSFTRQITKLGEDSESKNELQALTL